LAAFQAALSDFAANSIALVAASTEPQDNAQQTATRLGLTFPIGWGLPLEDTASRLGCYYEDRRSILHSTGFIVRPGGVVALVTYSSGAVGRLTPTDALSIVQFWQD